MNTSTIKDNGTGAAQMHERLASSELARDINRDVVLELLRGHQPIARVELARRSGLQRSTISAIVDQLIEEKWVREGASVRTPRGRRPTMLTLNEDVLLLVADVHPTVAIVAAVDLNGRFLSREVVPVMADPVKGVAVIVDAMLRLRLQFSGKTFEGIGISLPGRVSTVTQRLVLAPNLSWVNYDMKGVVEAKIGLQVELENAANACLMSELWFGRLNDVRNAVLVTISEGVGSAILANGQLVQGSFGLAGEFGHISLDPAGPLCACGQSGCWEMYASSRAALRAYAEGKSKQKVDSIHDLINRATSGEKAAVVAMASQAKGIGKGLRMVTAALSPEVILFAGDITQCWAMSAPLIEAELRQRHLAGPTPKLMPIGDGEMARLRGAAAVVLQRHTGYHRGIHSLLPRRMAS